MCIKNAISNLQKYSTDFWYFETGATKKDRRSFYGYKKAKRAFRIKKDWSVDLLLPALPFVFCKQYFVENLLSYTTGVGNGNGPGIQVLLLVLRQNYAF
jgi:hypothetical protein